MENINENIDNELKQVVPKEFIDDDNYDEFRMLSLYNKQQDIYRLQKTVKENRSKLVERPECLDFIDEALANVSVDDIKAMSDSDINKLFDPESEEEHIDIANPEDHEFTTQFKRDFLIFQKQTIITSKEIEEEQRKIDEEVEKCKDELNELVETYKSMGSLIKAKIVEKIGKTTDDHERKLYQSMLVYYDNGFNLNNVINFAKSYKGKSVYSDFVMDGSRSQYVYRTYKKECAMLNVQDELPRLTGLEVKFLPEKYHAKPNLFMYTVMAYIASWHNKNTDTARGIFITEFVTNIKNLFYDKFESEDDKQTFLSNIMTVLDLINE